MALPWELAPLLAGSLVPPSGRVEGTHASFCENHTLLPDDEFQPRAYLGAEDVVGRKGDRHGHPPSAPLVGDLESPAPAAPRL